MNLSYMGIAFDRRAQESDSKRGQHHDRKRYNDNEADHGSS